MIEAPTRILAVTDLSPAGTVAVAEAHRAARRAGGVLAVVHATPRFDASRPLFPQRLANDALLAANVPERAAARIREQLAEIGAHDDVEVYIEQGTTADVALGVVERWRPSVVVVGSPTDSAVGAIGLVRHVEVPVLVAKPSPTTRRVVVGTDFSDPSLPAIKAAAEVAAAWEGELVIVHAIEIHPTTIYGVIVPVFDDPIAVSAAVKTRLDEVVERLGITAKTEVAIGPAAAALVATAQRVEAELLVVATHGRTGLTRFVLGSVTEGVIHHAPCSVLVVRLR